MLMRYAINEMQSMLMTVEQKDKKENYDLFCFFCSFFFRWLFCTLGGAAGPVWMTGAVEAAAVTGCCTGSARAIASFFMLRMSVPMGGASTDGAGAAAVGRLAVAVAGLALTEAARDGGLVELEAMLAFDGVFLTEDAGLCCVRSSSMLEPRL